MTTHNFKDWNEVANCLNTLAKQQCSGTGWLDDGQRDSLRCLAKMLMLTKNGVIIADEVGMGKTRIAVALAMCVKEAGGRVAIVIPPGLADQWQKEFKAAGLTAPDLLRGLWPFLEVWMRTQNGAKPAVPWFNRDIVMISHGFTHQWLSSNSRELWRWSLLPNVIAYWKKKKKLNTQPQGFNAFTALQKGNQGAWDSQLKKLPNNHLIKKNATNLHDQVISSNGKAIAPLKAAEAIATFLQNLGRNHPLRCRAGTVIKTVQFIDAIDPSKRVKIRKEREQAVGLGLGSFDLVIIDEAHKSRNDDSGLSRTLELIVGNQDVRRLAMTATPVELDHKQWHQILKRTNPTTTIETKNGNGKDIFEQYANACDRVRQSPNDEDTRNDYKKAASYFQEALEPYVLRRTKLDSKSVQDFASKSQLPPHAYRQQEAVKVEIGGLAGGLAESWKIAVVAAEALSFVARQADDTDSTSKSKRLRLTMGNGHGIAALLDHVKQSRDDDEQIEQDKKDKNQVVALDSIEGKRKERAEWWQEVISESVKNQSRELYAPIYDHPAILAAIKKIESVTKDGGKVLVFGRFTQPLRALVFLLNARARLTGCAFPFNPPKNKDFSRKTYWLAACRQLNPDCKLAQPACQPDDLDCKLEKLSGKIESGADKRFAQLMYGKTPHDQRIKLQEAFNQPGSLPKVLVAQSIVGREGLNLHKACRTVVLLHPEWNPGVVEQQIGRVDRKGSQWETDLEKALQASKAVEELPRIDIHPIIFEGTYDEQNWEVLQKRWDDYRAQLHGIVITEEIVNKTVLNQKIANDINRCAPCFKPDPKQYDASA